MSKTHTMVTALLPPLLLLGLLSIIFLFPRQDTLLDAQIAPTMPLNYELPGWYGIKLQESEEERSTLAADTRFSKAAYTKLRESPADARGPRIVASVVYSGNDMNASIHRPERCLPAQGHLNLQSSASELSLADGQRLTFTRLTSRTPTGKLNQPALQHINYYIFVGHNSIQSTHLTRTLCDIKDRILHGYVQRWAYYQIGTYWGGSTGISEELAENHLRQLISQLTPIIMNKNATKKE